MQDGVAECTFNSKFAAAEIGYDDLQQLDGSSLYIAASVLESTGKICSFAHFSLIVKALWISKSWS